MKIINYHFESSSKEPVIITWSRNHASLLASFGFIIEVDGNFLNIYKENTYREKKEKEFIKKIHRNEIINFLLNKGANIKLGNTTKKIRNLSFSNFNN